MTACQEARAGQEEESNAMMDPKVAAPPPPQQAPADLSFGQDVKALVQAMKMGQKSPPPSMQQQAAAYAPNTGGMIGAAANGYMNQYNANQQNMAAQRQAAGLNSPAAWLPTVMKG